MAAPPSEVSTYFLPQSEFIPFLHALRSSLVLSFFSIVFYISANNQILPQVSCLLCINCSNHSLGSVLICVLIKAAIKVFFMWKFMESACFSMSVSQKFLANANISVLLEHFHRNSYFLKEARNLTSFSWSFSRLWCQFFEVRIKICCNRA